MVEGGSGAVFDINLRAATAGVGMIADIDGMAGRVIGGVMVENIAEKLGGAMDLVAKAAVFFVTSGVVGATIAGGLTIVKRIRDFVGDEARFFLNEGNKGLRIDMVCLGGLVDDTSGGLASANFAGGLTKFFFS